MNIEELKKELKKELQDEQEIADAMEAQKEIVKIQDERNEKHEIWLKHIITIAVGQISILVALKKSISKSFPEHVLFVLTISLLAVGIFCGVVALYGEIKILDKLRVRMTEYALQVLDGYKPAPKFELIPPDKKYKRCEQISLISFSLSLISLIIYAALSDI